jgi:hypothetical protein
MKTVITTTTITDDLGGAGDADTITFDHDGRTYEIDLNRRNADTFHRRVEALYGPYVAVARDVTDNTREYTRTVRAWATANGHQIAPRGRVPQHIIDLYETAQADA